MIIENANPHIGPSFSFTHRVKRQCWNVTYVVFFRYSFRPLHRWRAFLLSLFGAKLGKGVHIYPKVRVWAPWNLVVGNYVGIADDVNIYNMDIIEFGDYCVVSQGSHLCGGSHDYNSANFQLFAKPISLGRHTWICADSFIGLGVSVADGVVVGARSVVTKSIDDPWAVYAGHPAVRIKDRLNVINSK